MARLIDTAITSLDGYLEDQQGGFGWAAPDDEVHGFINDLERPVSVYLFGRRMYETMAVWETMGTDTDPAIIRDFADIWWAADKVVYSTTPLVPVHVGRGNDRNRESSSTRLNPEAVRGALRPHLGLLRTPTPRPRPAWS